HHFGQLQQALSLRVDVPNRECVENRSDTRSDDLRIVRQYRIFRWPVYARTWIHVFFKVIGMQLDQPRNNEIALPVFGGRQRAPALAYIMDLAVTQGHSAPDDVAGGHDLCICNHSFTQHVSSPASQYPGCGLPLPPVQPYHEKCRSGQNRQPWPRQSSAAPPDDLPHPATPSV